MKNAIIILGATLLIIIGGSALARYLTPSPVAPEPEVKPNVIGPLKPTPSGPAVTAWEVWMSEHSKTCPECGGFPDHGMCQPAFEKFQAALRADKQPIEITPSPVSPVSEPDATPLSAPVSSSCSGGNCAPRSYSAQPRRRWRLFNR